ncbi:DUF1804 family protein [Caenispirillum bisanense]|uniref:Uncharacterized protein n=1 Tax=Caenispirillum bisanense TaxID=414052 RepID=A0A286GYP6_9PROT|nr:DUF1804 family protein [Caenispirillum bisanense]SOE00655.1 Protein of unknown function [Caenispirillum bisanense]
MAHTPETKAAVRRSYIADRLGLEAAAERHGVSLPTARRWKSQAAAAGDDWDKIRAASAISHSGANNIAQLVLTDYLTLHQAALDGLNAATDVSPLDRVKAMALLGDSFTKITNAVSRAAPDVARHAVAIEVLHFLVDFLRANYPALATAFADVVEPFAAALSEKYGA